MRSKNVAYSEKLDHIRFFAALLVALFHCLILFESNKLISHGMIQAFPVTSILAQGYTGVSLFMTLSGFLFARICHDKDINLWSFYRNRFLRIYPLFLFLLFLACSLDPLQNDFWALCRSIFLAHNLKNSVFFPHFTEVLWTIPVEFQFYLLFPFLLTFYRKIGIRYLLLLLALSVGTKAAVFWFNGSVMMMAYTTIFGRIDQFVVGMILGFSFEKLRRYFSTPASFFGMLAFVLFCLWADNSELNHATTNPMWIVKNLGEAIIWGFLIVSYNATSFSLPRTLSKIIAFGGAISYSFYVNHFFFLQSAEQFYIPLVYGHHSRYPMLCQVAYWLQANPIMSVLCFAFLVELPLTILASVLTYYVIELPFLSLRTEYVIKPKQESPEPVILSTIA